MTKTKIIAITGIAVAAFAAWQYFVNLSSEVALMERFPDIDQKDVIAASRKMYFASLRGEFDHVDTNDEALMDHIFLSYVNNL